MPNRKELCCTHGHPTRDIFLPNGKVLGGSVAECSAKALECHRVYPKELCYFREGCVLHLHCIAQDRA
jgi:hypothetical protein